MSRAAVSLLERCLKDMKEWKKRTEIPEWFRDAKFGLFFHWGPYTVPEYDSEWYSRNMYDKDHAVNAYHKEKYGALSEFGYKDFIPMFKGEKFDPAKWADLVELSGARYAGPVCEHADNFSLWDSGLNPVNSVKMGPHRDVVGECFEEFRKRDIKCLATFHHQWQWGWFMGTDHDSDVYDPANRMFYGPIVPTQAGDRKPGVPPTQEFYCMWRDKVLEVVDRYDPDAVYFDSRTCIIPDSYKQEICEALYKREDTVITYKDVDFPKGTGVEDIEVRRFLDGKDFYWQEDDKLEAEFTWSYTRGGTYKTSRRIIMELCDIVAKNGNLLLNVGPREDGTFPEEAVNSLKGVGEWLKVNGEAIYGARPCAVCQEGPTDIREKGYYIKNEESGQEFVLEHTVVDFVPEDIRYTKKGDTVYAIVMGKPDGGSILMSALERNIPDIHEITMVGTDQRIEWRKEEGGIRVFFPDILPCEHVYVYRVK